MANRKVIYVVDDDPSMLKGMRRLLTLYGYEALPFENGQALRDHDEFDDACCIVLDINLSDGSGIELRHQLTEAGVRVPVIFITGNDSDATRMAANAAGCLAYLTKPFTARSLIESIERSFEASA